MGTKLTELRDGCFHAAMDDEPMFVLLARDPNAPFIVEIWANHREHEVSEGRRPASDMAKVIEARQCAENMRNWRSEHDGEWRTGLYALENPVDTVKRIFQGARFTSFDEESTEALHKSIADLCKKCEHGKHFCPICDPALELPR